MKGIILLSVTTSVLLHGCSNDDDDKKEEKEEGQTPKVGGRKRSGDISPGDDQPIQLIISPSYFNLKTVNQSF